MKAKSVFIGLFVVFALGFSLILAGCDSGDSSGSDPDTSGITGTASSSSSFVGTWKGTDYDGEPLTLILKQDFIYTLIFEWGGASTLTGTFSISGNTITLFVPGETITGIINGATIYIKNVYFTKTSSGTDGGDSGVNGITNFTVTFNSNGGNGAVPEPQTMPAGTNITLPGGSGLTRAGYSFGGWNTNAAGTGTNYSAGSLYTVTGSIIFYAKWGAPSNVVGTWVLQGPTTTDRSGVSQSTLFTLILNDDFTLNMICITRYSSSYQSGQIEQSYKGTYSVSGNTIMMLVASERVVGTVNGNTIDSNMGTFTRVDS